LVIFEELQDGIGLSRTWQATRFRQARIPARQLGHLEEKMLFGESARLGTKGRWFVGTSMLALLGVGLFLVGLTKERSFPVPRRGMEPGAPSRMRPVVETDESRVAANFGNLPLSFEPNQGQTDSQVKFLSRSPHYNLFLTSNEAVFTLPIHSSKASLVQGRVASLRNPRSETQAVLRMEILGANTTASVEGEIPSEGHTNYLTGSNSGKWVRNVPQYARVHYRGVYPGVDLTFYGQQRQLEFDFIVKPGADPAAIALGIQGAKKIRTDQAGDLVLTSAAGDLRLHKPVAYQRRGEVRQLVDAGFVVNGQKVALAVGGYDRASELVIDPSIAYSTYLGGGNEDDGFGIAVDGTGAAYITGQTLSSGFPTKSGSYQTTFKPTQDAFVTKLTTDGSALVYSTFLAGTGTSGGSAIAIDGSKNAYVVGSTTATDFPTNGTITAAQPNSGGKQDAFVVKLSADGSSLLYSTYLGGAEDEIGFGVAIDALGGIYAVGETKSTNFPTTAPIQGVNLGGSDGFVTKINPDGSRGFSDYLGGSKNDTVTGVALDPSAKFYVSGITFSTDLIPSPSFQACTGCTGTVDHSFVAAIQSTVSGFGYIYRTYLHGSGTDEANLIAVDALSNAYVVGLTASTDFPTNGSVAPYQSALHSGATSNAFISKLNPTGTGLLYSTYVGGSGADDGIAIAVDASGVAYVTGVTSSTDFPTTTDATQATNAGGGSDAFVAKLNTTVGGGGGLLFSTYLGGKSAENATKIAGIAIDIASPPNIFVTGQTQSDNFPFSAGAFQTAYSSSGDAFVVKYSPQTLPSQFRIDIGAVSPSTIARGSTGTATVTVTSTGFAGDVPLSCSITPTAGAPSCSVTSPVTVTNGGTSPPATLTITTTKPAVVRATGSALWLPLPGLILAGAGLLSSPRSKKKMLRILLGTLAFTGLLLMMACGSGNVGGGGGGGGGTTPGSYTVTVQGGVNGTPGTATFSVQ